MLKQGLYEQLINRMIGAEIKDAEERGMYVDAAPVDTGEASKVLSQYLAEVIEKGLDNVRGTLKTHKTAENSRKNL